MKRLLRGIIDFDDKNVPKDAVVTNFQRLRTSKIDWANPVDEKIYTYVKEFFIQNFELPTSHTILDFFSREEDVEVTERLGDIAKSVLHTRKNYEHLLNQLLEDQQRVAMKALLKDTEEIVSRGRVVQQGKEKKKLQGVKDALVYFQGEAHDLLPVNVTARTHGDLRDDRNASWEEYLKAKHEKDKVWGAFTGLEQIDRICHGAKRGDLWVHAAFTGELKTTFALNWCHNLVTKYRVNVMYVSLEVPYEQIRRNINSIHSAHRKFALQGKAPLDYRRIRDGELTDEEEVFYQEVLTDFETNPEYTRFKVWATTDATIDDIRIEAELYHKQMDVGFIVIDHGELVKPTTKHNDYTIQINSIIRDAKKALALRFNGQEGVPVLFLYQLNRQGKDDADKNGGEYKLKALSYANECERSADVVTTTYLNLDHRRDKTTVMCNLKNRDNPLFEKFIASVDFKSRRICNFDPTISTTTGMRTDTPEGHEELLEGLLGSL